ncbi:MAG TPA: class I SAM-dependent methyltransferase [Thermoanaerobaculia bacterium]|nr:class I SAM-dependent methyltransferase [Thermoanaerobaculia bacterium]
MPDARPYQLRYSEIAPLMVDEESRRKKARKILAILRHALVGLDLQTLKLLDIGSSAGIITSELAKQFGHVTGIDIDESGLLGARKYMWPESSNPPTAPEAPSSRRALLLGDAMRLPFFDSSFDVVILNHVYEHVPDAQKLIDESWRVVKPGRIVYFAADNRFGPIEPHYRLAGLSWFPRRVSNAYLKITGKGSVYYEHLLSLQSVRRLVARFELDDYTLRVIGAPNIYFADDQIKHGKYGRALFALARLFYWFLPTYLFILRKPTDRKGCLAQSRE